MLVSLQISPPEVLQAGFGAFVVGALVVTALVAAFQIHLQNKNQGDLSQGNDVQVTLTQEGSVITWIEGRVKIAGNIVDNNPAVTEEIKSSGGGKGLGGNGGGATQGNRVFMDIWQGLCRVAPLGLGRAKLIETYISQTPEEILASDVIFNDGTNGLFPDFFDGAGPKPGVCHVAYQRMFLGENVNSVPNIQFIMEKESLGPIPNSNLDNGTNPACSAYDQLLESGVKPNEINISSFFTAANFWFNRGYGINLEFKNQIKGKDAILKTLNYVDGIFFRNREGKYTIRALDKNDPSVITITDKETKDFAINRKGWKQVPNKFVATFIDEDKNFTKRVVVVENTAAILTAGREIDASIDLVAFRDLNTAAKRLAELAKRMSFPVASFRFKTFLKYSILQPGDVFTIDFDRSYNGQNLSFTKKARLKKITIPRNDSVEVEIEAVELIEGMHDDAFLVQGGSDAVQIDFTPIELDHIKIFELAYNPLTKKDLAFIVFPVRKKGFETGYDVYVSNSADQDFEKTQSFSTFSFHGTLVNDYGTTFKIDDEVGITFTPTNLNDVPVTISRDRLFAYDRVVCIGGELMAFEQVITLGNGDIKLLGIVRGIYDTPIENHSVGAEIFLADISSNILDRVQLSNFYIKLVPKFLGNQAEINTITAINITSIAKAKKPRQPGRLIANRSGGNNIELEIVPTTPGIPGAGDVFTSETDKEKPHDFEGEFLISYNAVVDQVISTDTINITEASALTIDVKHRINNHVSDTLSILVDSADGTYYA